MAVVTGAFAQATISGVIDQAYYTSKITTSAGVTSTTKGVGAQNNGTSEFTISGSEDLGGGMKASYGFNVQADLGAGATDQNSAPALTTGTNNGMAMRRSHIGLAGDFGSIKLGNQWTPAFFVALAADPTRLVSTTGAGLVAAATSIGASANSITYDLPALVPGVAIQLQKGQGEATTTAGNNSGFSLTYSSGALMAAYASQTLVAGSGTTFTTSAGAGSTIVTSLATLTAGSSKISSGVATVTYDLGMAKVHLNTTSDKVTGTTAKTSGNAVGVSVPLGAATTLGLITSSTKSTNTSSTAYNQKGTRYALFHNLSKRTTAYAFAGKSSLSGATTGHAMTAFGLQHGF